MSLFLIVLYGLEWICNTMGSMEPCWSFQQGLHAWAKACGPKDPGVIQPHRPISRQLFGFRPWCTAKCCRKMRVPQNQEENHGNQSIQSIPDHFLLLLKVKTKTFHIFAVPYGCSKVHHQNLCRKQHCNQLQVYPRKALRKSAQESGQRGSSTLEF